MIVMHIDGLENSFKPEMGSCKQNIIVGHTVCLHAQEGNSQLPRRRDSATISNAIEQSPLSLLISMCVGWLTLNYPNPKANNVIDWENRDHLS